MSLLHTSHKSQFEWMTYRNYLFENKKDQCFFLFESFRMQRIEWQTLIDQQDANDIVLLNVNKRKKLYSKNWGENGTNFGRSIFWNYNSWLARSTSYTNIHCLWFQNSAHKNKTEWKKVRCETKTAKCKRRDISIAMAAIPPFSRVWRK